MGLNARNGGAYTGAMWTFLEGIRPARWWAVFLAALVYTLVLISSFWLDESPVGDGVEFLRSHTRGVVSALLVYPLLALASVMFLLLRGGGLSCADLGWKRRSLPSGLVVLVLAWLALGPVFSAVVPPEAGFDGLLMERHVELGISALLTNLFGNALAEETVFRALLVPQLFLLGSRWLERRHALLFAMLVSCAWFTLSHVPMALSGEVGSVPFVYLSWVFLFGLGLAAVFLATRNLFVCVVLHALWNAQQFLYVPFREDLELAWWLVCYAVIFVWAGVPAVLVRLRRIAFAPRAPAGHGGSP